MANDSLKHLWLPYSQMKTALDPLQAVATAGHTIQLSDGRIVLDGVASWWTACHGYNHPHIVSSIKKQLDIMPHIMFGGLIHQPAIDLASRLSKLAPGDLDRVFFVDSGSVAVEVAQKMAVQYWLNKQQQGRTKFVHFRHGYHGDTMACMALCDPLEGMHAYFKEWLPQNLLAELPINDKTTCDLETLLKREHASIAGIVIEPLVQGAGGMKFHDAATLKAVASLCSKYNLLLIADEIFTGFGRTGTFFACEQAQIVPDIMCVGKALTGGTISLAATLARQHVFEAFWSDQPQQALMHGPTYMANPLACAAANASLDLFESEPRLEQIKKMEIQLIQELGPCRDVLGVVDVRVKGAIGVVQLQEITDLVWLKKAFVAEGVWIRPFHDIIYLTPAYTMGSEELSRLTRTVGDVVKQWSSKFA